MDFKKYLNKQTIIIAVLTIIFVYFAYMCSNNSENFASENFASENIASENVALRGMQSSPIINTASENVALPIINNASENVALRGMPVSAIPTPVPTPTQIAPTQAAQQLMTCNCVGFQSEPSQPVAVNWTPPPTQPGPVSPVSNSTSQPSPIVPEVIAPRPATNPPGPMNQEQELNTGPASPVYAGNWQVLAGTNYPNNNDAVIKNATPVMCEQMCSNSSNCVGIVFKNDKSCTLKSKLVNPIADSTVTTYFPKGSPVPELLPK